MLVCIYLFWKQVEQVITVERPQLNQSLPVPLLASARGHCCGLFYISD